LHFFLAQILSWNCLVGKGLALSGQTAGQFME